jgi:GNAT superfamily N-acetyltransferase
MQLLEFTKDMQQQVIQFFEKCFVALGWGYSPNGRHIDTADIEKHYMQNGCFWCLFDNHVLIGTVAVRTIDFGNKIFELKRMFILPEHQGKGYGRQLLNHAIDYAKEQKYSAICLDTRNELTTAQHMYKNHGFKQIDKYNNNEYADVYFELKLTESQ